MLPRASTRPSRSGATTARGCRCSISSTSASTRRGEFKRWQLGLYLDVQNVYNYQAAEGISYNFNYTKREYVTGLPFLPTLGLRGDF